MDSSLTDKELKHIRISQAWLGLFLQLCFEHSNVLEWKIGGWSLSISNLFTSTLNYHEDINYSEFIEKFSGLEETSEVNKENKIKVLKTLISWESEPGIGAGNETQKKYVSIINADESWNTNHAYVDIWDAKFINAPRLNFVGRFNKESFEEFEGLFKRFLSAETQAEIDLFKEYIISKYSNTSLYENF